MTNDPRWPAITIITPSFNQGQFIERTIRSVLDQGYPNLEYLVIDGGSTDGTIDVLRRHESSLRWVSEPDRGQSDAINKGLRQAKGAIIGYLNSDDVLRPGCLAAIAEYFQGHPERQWLTGYARIIDEHDRPIQSPISRYKNFLLRHYHRRMLYVINFISQMSTFWRADAMNRIGYYSVDHHLVMDYDYWLRLLTLGDPGIVRRELSGFRVHGASKGGNRFVEQFRQSYALGRTKITNPLLVALAWLHNYLVIAIYQVMLRRPAKT